jgi:phage host-nuclease inhibitor protein Gam
MKKAIVDGVEISEGAVRFEYDRLVRFYKSHGFSDEALKDSASELEAKALDQAIGARLLLNRAVKLDVPVTAEELDAEVEKIIAQVGGVENYRAALSAQGLDENAFKREIEKGAKVNKLVAQVCSLIPDPTEDEIDAFFEANRNQWSDGGKKTIVDVHDDIRDLLRHEARGRGVDEFVAELRENAEIKFECD